MTNWYSIFYWLTVADGVKTFFDVTSNIFTWIAVLSFILYVIFTIGKASTLSGNNLKNAEEENQDSDFRSWEIGRKYAARLFYSMLVLSLITWFGYIATPTKKDCLLIVAGGAVGNFMMTDSSAKELPSDVTKFLHLSLKNEIKDLSDDTKRQLDVQTPKEKLLDKAKDLSKEELIKFLEKDTTVLK